MRIALPGRFSIRNIALPLVCLCAFLLWLWGRSSVSFLDDILLNVSNLVDLKSPLGFFIPGTRSFKAWPLGATLIWTLAQLGLNSLAATKLLIFGLHVANTFLIRKLLRTKSLFLALVYFFHPALFLSLSWAFQIGTVSSLFLVLTSLVLLSKSTWKYGVGAFLFLFLSFLVKPWAVLLLPYFLWIVVQRSHRDRFGLAVLSAVAVLMMGFAFRAWTYGSSGFSFYPSEQVARLGFLTGNPINVDPNHPPTFEDIQKQIDSVPFELRLLRTTLNMSASAAQYASMAVGANVDIVQPPPSSFGFTNALGAGLMIGIFSLLLMQLRRARHSESARRWVFALIVLLAGWLPESGLVYIPHFKFSFISPHYFALMLPGVVFCLDAVFAEIRWGQKSAVLAVLVCVFAIRQGTLYWHLNHDAEFQDKARPVLISP